MTPDPMTDVPTVKARFERMVFVYINPEAYQVKVYGRIGTKEFKIETSFRDQNHIEFALEATLKGMIRTIATQMYFIEKFGEVPTRITPEMSDEHDLGNIHNYYQIKYIKK